MNPAKKVKFEKLVNVGYKNLAGIVVQQAGETVYEAYYNGYTASDPVHIFSVTKSIVSALIGIAIHQGLIKSVDEKILSFFPDYQVKKGEITLPQLTIKHLLTMTAPYKCKTEPYVKVFTSDNWILPALDLLGGKGKVGEFCYSPIVGTHLLSAILVKATQRPVLDFAKENLFAPLGISVGQDIILHNKEEHIAFGKGQKISGWAVDPQGIHTAGWGLTLTPRDMVKIGQLYLAGGKWQGEQLIPKAWVDETLALHSQYGKMGYGYLWWLMDQKAPLFAALGQCGNIIYVNAEKKLVIAMTALFVQQEKDTLKLIKDYIEPMLYEG